MTKGLSFGRLIKLKRKERGLTQEELASILKIDRTLLSKIETDDKKPSPALLRKISIVLNYNFYEDFLTKFLERDGVPRGALKLQEAARVLSVSPGFLRKLAKEKKIPAIKLGHRWLFRVQSLEEFLKKMEQAFTMSNEQKGGGQNEI
jgi:excisionase family DNA binding protein